MQQRPDLTSLIDAVETFLRTDVRPAVEDRAIRFRLLIASNLLGQVAAELRNQDTLRGDELASLATLFHDERDDEPGDERDAPAGTNATRTQRIAALDARLVERIRDASTGPDELARIRRHLLTTLGATLAATDPSFNLSMKIE